jgi:hypothetical protein
MGELRRKLRARIGLLSEALAARRAGGRGLLAQAWDLLRLRCGPTRLRAWEYYDFRLWQRRFRPADQRLFGGEWLKRRIHARLNNKAWEVLMTDKLVEAAYFRALGLPHADVLAVAAADPRLHGAAPSFCDPGALCEFLRRGIPYPVFVKPVKGQEGRSCCSILRYDAAGDILLLGDGTRIGVEEFLARLSDPTGFGIAFVEKLETHPAIGALCGEAVSSLRVIVLVGRDGPALLHADWAIPAGRSMVSNFAKGETGNLIGGIDLESGRITRVLGGTGRERRDLELHPVTGRPLVGFRLPDWPESLDLCLRAARGFPGARWQNWDVGLTARGPVLLELNSSGDIYSPQYLQERGILAGPLGGFLGRHRYKDDRPGPLFPRRPASPAGAPALARR